MRINGTQRIELIRRNRPGPTAVVVRLVSRSAVFGKSRNRQRGSLLVRIAFVKPEVRKRDPLPGAEILVTLGKELALPVWVRRSPNPEPVCVAFRQHGENLCGYRINVWNFASRIRLVRRGVNRDYG